MSHASVDAIEQTAQTHGATWVPIAAAIIAVVTAIFGLAGSQRSAASQLAKSQAIITFGRSSDAARAADAHAVREEVDRAFMSSGTARNPRALAAAADRERAAAAPLLAQATALETQAHAFDTRADTLRHGAETIEVGVTLLDIAIVLISISALATTRLLTVVAVTAVVSGAAIALYGFVSSLG